MLMLMSAVETGQMSSVETTAADTCPTPTLPRSGGGQAELTQASGIPARYIIIGSAAKSFDWGLTLGEVNLYT